LLSSLCAVFVPRIVGRLFTIVGSGIWSGKRSYESCYEYAFLLPSLLHNSPLRILQKKIMTNQQTGTPLSSSNVYQDYADVTEQDMKAPPSSKKESNFPERLHYVLSEMEKDGLQHIASWQPHGRCFLIHDLKLFAEKILPL
jgi:hypothetical protein